MEVLYFLIALLVLAIMIFVHELGHYTAGRLLGFRILDFSLGFGPALFQFKKKGINYALRAIPLGGACRFYGEDDDPKELPGGEDDESVGARPRAEVSSLALSCTNLATPPAIVPASSILNQ